jgi:small conductance mechanosensitive channel
LTPYQHAAYGSDLIVIGHLVVLLLEVNCLKNFFHKASNNEALEHLFSTVVYVAILSIGFYYAWRSWIG